MSGKAAAAAKAMSKNQNSPPANQAGAIAGAQAPGGEYTPFFREYSLLIEYKHLRKYAPGGVYVMPSLETLHIWYGIIFIRQGHYRQGIFKFVMTIPEDYPEARPAVKFFTPVFHPQIDAQGNLDLSAGFPTWTPHKDYLWHVLAYVKRIFYKIPLDSAFNKEAVKLYVENREQFLVRVNQCVKASVAAAHENPEGSSIKFTDWKPHHEVVRERILSAPEQAEGEGEKREGLLTWVTKGFSKLVTGSPDKRRSSPAK